jgi:hypothetical protein
VCEQLCNIRRSKIMLNLRCSELSSGLYCRVRWLSTDVTEVRTASIIRAVQPRRQLWTSYSPPWELEISHKSEMLATLIGSCSCPTDITDQIMYSSCSINSGHIYCDFIQRSVRHYVQFLRDICFFDALSRYSCISTFISASPRCFSYFCFFV